MPTRSSPAPISVNILLGLYEAAERVVADARAITIPTQLLISGSDWVVHHGPQHRFFERLGSRVKERHILPGFFHDTLGERDRAAAIDKARAFILARFDEPPERAIACSTPTASASRATRRTGSPRRSPRSRRAASTGRCSGSA